MRLHRLLVLAVVLLAVPGAAQAAAPWHPAQTVSRTAGDRPAAAIGGQSVVTWAAMRPGGGGSGLYAVRRVSAARFGAPQALYTDRRGLDDAAVQIDRDGDAVIAFRRLIERNHRIASVTLRRSGARTGPISLSGPGSSAYDPTFGTPPAGSLAREPVLAWWRRETDRVQTSRAVNGRLLVSANGTLPGATEAGYALRADGTLLGAGTSGTAQAAVGALTASGFDVQTLAAAGGPFRSPAIATGSGMTAAVVWRAYDRAAGHYVLRASVRRDGAGFGSAVTVSAPGETPGAPQVTITPAGRLRIAYVAAGTGGGSVRGPLRLVTPGEAPRSLTARGTAAREFRIATDRDGETTVVWNRFVFRRPGGEVLTRTVSDAGTSPIRRLSDPREPAYGLSLGVGPGGDAVLAWTTGLAVRAVTRPTG